MRLLRHQKTAVLSGLCLIGLLSWGCDKGELPAHSTYEQPLEEREQALIVLDKRINADEQIELIAGRRQQVKPGTDAPRVIVLEQVPSGLGIKAGQRVLDAQFVSDGAVILGDDQVLTHYTGGHQRQLDVEVLGPISVAANKIAYTRGLPPDLSLITLALDGVGEPERLAPKLNTVWSPALSEDGQEVIFVASYEGRPRQFRISGAGEPAILRKGGPMPSSAVAPIWRQDYLAFEHEQGVVLLDLKRAQVAQEYLEAKLMPDDDSGQIKIWDGAQERVILKTQQERQ